MKPADRDAAQLHKIARSIERAFPTYSHEIRVIAHRMTGRIETPRLPPVYSRQTVHEIQHRDGRTVLVLRQRTRSQFGLASVR